MGAKKDSNDDVFEKNPDMSLKRKINRVYRKKCKIYNTGVKKATREITEQR